MSKFIPSCTNWKFSTSVSYLFSMVNTIKENKADHNLKSLKQGFLMCDWELWILPRLQKQELDTDGKAALDDRIANRPWLLLLGVVADAVQWNKPRPDPRGLSRCSQLQVPKKACTNRSLSISGAYIAPSRRPTISWFGIGAGNYQCHQRLNTLLFCLLTVRLQCFFLGVPGWYPELQSSSPQITTCKARRYSSLSHFPSHQGTKYFPEGSHWPELN